MLEVKVSSNTKGVTEESGPWERDTAAVEEVQLEELSADELVNVNKESGCDQKAKNVPEYMMLAKVL